MIKLYTGKKIKFYITNFFSKCDQSHIFVLCTIYYIWKNIKTSYRNSNNCKMSRTTWKEEFELPNGSYSTSDIQDYFEHIIKRHETITEKPPAKIYVKWTQNRVTFKIKCGYYLELLTPKNMKLLESTEEKLTNGKYGENLQRLQNVEVVFTGILSVTNISVTHGSCLHLFQIKHLVSY